MFLFIFEVSWIAAVVFYGEDEFHKYLWESAIIDGVAVHDGMKVVEVFCLCKYRQKPKNIYMMKVAAKDDVTYKLNGCLKKVIMIHMAGLTTMSNALVFDRQALPEEPILSSVYVQPICFNYKMGGIRPRCKWLDEMCQVIWFK